MYVDMYVYQDVGSDLWAEGPPKSVSLEGPLACGSRQQASTPLQSSRPLSDSTPRPRRREAARGRGAGAREGRRGPHRAATVRGRRFVTRE